MLGTCLCYVPLSERCSQWNFLNLINLSWQSTDTPLLEETENGRMIQGSSRMGQERRCNWPPLPHAWSMDMAIQEVGMGIAILDTSSSTMNAKRVHSHPAFNQASMRGESPPRRSFRQTLFDAFGKASSQVSK